MNIIYAVDKNSFDNKNHLGVVKKVESQMNQMRQMGASVELCKYFWENGYPQIKVKKDTDVLYFRKIDHSIKFIKKLKSIKKTNSNIKIIMEIPTYPYHLEIKDKLSIKRKVSLILGKILMHRYIDVIVLIAEDKTIKRLFNIPVIHIDNGIEYDKVSLKKNNTSNNKQINLLCVSGCYFWHGYDRLIEGMHNYYESNPQMDVILHVAGEGECLSQYKDLASKYGLIDDKIYFYGNKSGEELDRLYDISNMAVDCLGAHRKGLYYTCSLKSKEYVAKGLPFITSVRSDMYNEKTKEFIHMFPADETPIDVNEIIRFYNGIYINDNINMTENVRNTFYPYCDWKIMYKPVINYLNTINMK